MRAHSLSWYQECVCTVKHMHCAGVREPRAALVAAHGKQDQPAPKTSAARTSARSKSKALDFALVTDVRLRLAARAPELDLDSDSEQPTSASTCTPAPAPAPASVSAYASGYAYVSASASAVASASALAVPEALVDSGMPCKGLQCRRLASHQGQYAPTRSSVRHLKARKRDPADGYGKHSVH